MENQDMTIKNLAEQQLIVIDYSDDDIIIIDNIKQLAEPNPTRIKMNMVAIAKKGKAQILLNGKYITFSANQLLICPPNTLFTDFMFSPEFEFKAIFLTNRIIQSFLREKINIWNDTMYVIRRHLFTMQAIDIEFFSRYYDLLQMLIDAPAEHYPYRTQSIQSLLRAAFLGLCGALKQLVAQENSLPATIKTPVHHRQGSAVFRQFLEMVNSDHDKSLTVNDYASRLYVSPKYLSAICKRISGKTSSEWIREHIMEEIRYYLEQTDLSLKQIADTLNFGSASFFGKYVKEHFGKTPLQIRENRQ